MKVLYVEDNPANVFLVKRVARMGNHEIINYIDGNQALSKFDEISPDLVLMDIQLAGDKTGLDVVKELRERGVKTPIIAVTAYAMVGDKERCLEAGCDDYLAKPLPIPRLVEMFKSYSEAATSSTPQTVEPVAETKSDTPAPDKTTPVAETKPEAPAPEKVAPVVESKPETPAPESVAPVAETKPEAPAPEKVAPVVESKPEAPAPESVAPVAETKPEAPAPEKATPVTETKPEATEEKPVTTPEATTEKTEASPVAVAANESEKASEAQVDKSDIPGKTDLQEI